MTDTIKPPPSDMLAFKEALRGGRGDLDAWLECHYEAEVRAHVNAYADAAVAQERASADRLRAALRGLLTRDERNTCQHDETHRGGAIWEICDGCDMKWADDRGGRPEWQDPPEWVAARAALGETI